MQPLLQWKNNKHYILWMCVCSLRYPACNSHVPHCHLWPIWLYNIFPHCLINSTIFKKKLLNIKYVFWYSLQLLSEMFLILWRIQWDIIINTFYSCQMLMKFEFSQYILGKYSNIKFHKNPSSDSQAVPRGWRKMERRDKANSHFL
jgi:hypothetical protein